ncbi:TIGR03758 family integrating conjugative element protein, partial [Salmonella enterica subsp. enterica serovar Newport]|nr:TIGR03758 family integrating conjugative element protein [Salmonella enterica subsp. enterica serovar Newport]
MGMTSAQSTAFKAASGNVEVSILHLVCIGGLLACRFLWAAWALSGVWTGWSNEKG